MPDSKVVDQTTYEIIKSLECTGTLNLLLVKGLVSVNILNEKDMYESFKKYFAEDRNGKMDSYQLASIDFDCSVDTIRLAVRKMER